MDGDATNASRGAPDRKEDGRSGPPPLRGGFVAALLGAAALATLAWYFHSGFSGLVGSLVGILFGALVIAVGRWFVARQASAGNLDLIRETLVGSFASVVLFLGGIVVLSQVWKPGLVPATITALALYLAWKFQEVLSLSTPARRRFRASSAGGKGEASKTK